MIILNKQRIEIKFIELQDTETDVYIYVDFSIFN